MNDLCRASARLAERAGAAAPAAALPPAHQRAAVSLYGRRSDGSNGWIKSAERYSVPKSPKRLSIDLDNFQFSDFRDSEKLVCGAYQPVARQESH